jgi:hypothetical protein
MSEVVRISDEAQKFVEERQKDSEDFPEALDRLLGVQDPEDPVTREDVEEIFDEKLQQLVKELNEE